MSALQEIKFWYAYNSHVRKAYLKKILSLPKDEVLKDRGASYPSILDIFVHILDGYRYWFFVVREGDPETGFSRWQGNTRIEELKEREREVDGRVMASIGSLSEGDLKSKIMGGSFELRDLLNHLIEEELQHRGELNALFWQMDVSPPVSGIEDAKYVDMHLSGERCPRCG